jgi:hypothetical protein
VPPGHWQQLRFPVEPQFATLVATFIRHQKRSSAHRVARSGDPTRFIDGNGGGVGFRLRKEKKPSAGPTACAVSGGDLQAANNMLMVAIERRKVNFILDADIR